MGSLEDHYAHLARSYDENWSHSEAFLDWMTGEIAARLLPTNAANSRDPSVPFGLHDIGAGTGLYASRLLPLLPSDSHIYCVDPSRAMLDEAHSTERITPVVSAAEDAPTALDALGASPANAILLKEVVHHFERPGSTLAGLCGLLASGGRLLVVMLPPTIDYPLFAEAIRRYEQGQPHYDSIADALRASGLDVTVDEAAFPLEFETERYLRMVESRYMSVLSSFSDDELAAGLDEMRSAIGRAPVVSFSDSFVFVLGVNAG